MDYIYSDLAEFEKDIKGRLNRARTITIGEEVYLIMNGANRPGKYFKHPANWMVSIDALLDANCELPETCFGIDNSKITQNYNFDEVKKRVFQAHDILQENNIAVTTDKKEIGMHYSLVKRIRPYVGELYSSIIKEGKSIQEFIPEYDGVKLLRDALLARKRGKQSKFNTVKSRKIIFEKVSGLLSEHRTYDRHEQAIRQGINATARSRTETYSEEEIKLPDKKYDRKDLLADPNKIWFYIILKPQQKSL
jgi:hypothetical protein